MTEPSYYLKVVLEQEMLSTNLYFKMLLKVMQIKVCWLVAISGDGVEPVVRKIKSGNPAMTICVTLLMSLKAGGLGLNLTAANYVILMDPWWNPSIEDQATDRAHRIGQERNVTVVRLVSANTIEEKILKLHEQKQDLSDRILEGTSGTASLTMDEILDMVSPYR